MSSQSRSCNDIFQQILKGGAERERGVKILFETQFTIFWKLRKRWSALEMDEVKDAYTDAIFVLVQRVEAGKFEFVGNDPCAAFLYRVAENKCNDIWRKRKNEVDASGDLAEADRIVVGERYDYDKELLNLCFGKLNETCKVVLTDWMAGYNMREIAGRNELANANVAAVTRKRCMNKLVDLLKRAGVKGLNS